MSSAAKPAIRQESHRIHWQHWNGESKRDLITTSAALRLSDAAKTVDVTKVLRQSLKLTAGPTDALVLVGTVFQHKPIVFEHEQPHEAAHSNKQEPMHIVRTLRDDDNPLQVRDEMLIYLKQKEQEQDSVFSRNSFIAPKLQWFFVPADPLSNIPSSVNLEGYCTDMEEKNEQNDDTDSDASEEEGEEEVGMPWRSEQLTSTKSTARHQTQVRRCQQLAHYRCTLDHHCVSGFLLKQSNKDPHVWKRVHCVLTEDYLWYITRVKHGTANHSRIKLTRALLLDNYTALQRLPHALEVVSEHGISHVFRASSKNLQLRWIQCLADRIVECHENNILDHAELICQDEAMARSVRRARSLKSQEFLRWSLEVSEYKEICRHIAARLPTENSRTTTVQQPSSLSSPSSSYSAQAQIESALREIILSTWDMASILLAKATSFCAGKGPNIETLCRHIDYVLTGRFRSIQDNALLPSHLERSKDAPPADLFDNLLSELQKRK